MQAIRSASGMVEINSSAYTRWVPLGWAISIDSMQLALRLKRPSSAM